MNSFVRRGLATGIDVIVVFVLYNVTYNTLNTYGVSYAKLLAYLNCYLYIIAFAVFVWEGQTLGKRIMKLTVASVDNVLVDKKMIFVRELCKCILFTKINTGMLLIYVLFALLNKNNQALHDLFSGTQVISVDCLGIKSKA